MKFFTHRTGQKNASAILNPPNKNPSSFSPSSANRALVTLRALSQIVRTRMISFRACSGTGIFPVYCARKLVWYVFRIVPNPECISAAALRASALSFVSAGHRLRWGFDSARNSQMERESLIWILPRDGHSSTGTRPELETVGSYAL